MRRANEIWRRSKIGKKVKKIDGSMPPSTYVSTCDKLTVITHKNLEHEMNVLVEKEYCNYGDIILALK